MSVSEPDEPPVEPTHDDNAMNGSVASADAVQDALSKNPDLKGKLDDIRASVNDGTYQTKYPKGTPEGDLAEQLAKGKDESISYINQKAGPGINVAGPKPFDQSTPQGVKNSDGFLAWIGRFFGFRPSKTNPDGSLSQSDKDNIAKKTADLENQAKDTVNPKLQLALKILALLGPVVPALVTAWKLKKLEEFLEQIAQSLNECDEVNYSKRTQDRLQCNTNNPLLKTNCICSGTGAPALQGICTTFDPTHTCPDYDYVYFEYHWYDLFAAVVHGGEDVSIGLWDWLKSHKWTMIISVIVFLVILVAFGMAKRYAFSSAPSAPAVPVAPVAPVAPSV